MYTIHMINSHEYLISESQYQGLLKAIKAKERFIHLADSGVTLMINSISDIAPASMNSAKESAKLISQGFFKCHAGIVHKLGEKTDPYRDKCSCEVKKKALELPPAVKNLISGAKMEGFPEPSYEDMLISRAESGERRAKSIIKSKSFV